MIFAPYLRNNECYGHQFHSDRHHFFFGNAALTDKDLSQFFPQYSFAFLKQVHGKTIVEGDPRHRIEADAAWTTRRELALVVQTADCIPLLVGAGDVICAIHAGWRGLAAGIIGDAAQFLSRRGYGPFLAALGPHIMRNDFEVGRDVADQIVKGLPLSEVAGEFLFAHDDPKKLRVDLAAVAQAQLRHGLSTTPALYVAQESTYSSGEYHSFRRQRAAAGRNLSFIALY